MPQNKLEKGFGFTTFSSHERGFTLIELLVTVSIIAVLATIGATIFTGTQNKAKDSARKADIVAIAKALEANYNPVTGAYDTTKIVNGTAFASGQIPTPPEGGQYFGDLTADGKGFRICASLSDSTPFCVDSEQGTYNETPPPEGTIMPGLGGSLPGSPTSTPGPTNTPSPTLPGPTNTPTPTSVAPTATPSPTTPPPTATPTSPPPTATPTPSPTNPPAGGPQRIFVTSTFYTGNLGGLAGADAACQTRAAAASLTGTWQAWLSSETIPATSRLPNSTNSYVKLNGVTVANNWNDLTDGALLSPIDRNEFVALVSGTLNVWTGTSASGGVMSGLNCTNWTSSATSGSYGFANVSTSGWTNAGSRGCGSIYRLYCIDTSNP